MNLPRNFVWDRAWMRLAKPRQMDADETDLICVDLRSSAVEIPLFAFIRVHSRLVSIRGP
jgi:hypothetical protein